MAEVKVCFRAVFGYIAFAVLIGIQCPGVDVDIWIEFLDGDAKPAGLQEFGQGCRHNALPEG